MKEISFSELKAVQIDILTAVDKFCSDNNIIYSMAYGTLLGAVRHKGYIPWDDDIDICMIRHDYERFVKEFPDCLGDRYKIASINRTNNWHSPFAKVYDERTVLKQKKTKTIEIGVNIDVFPLDDVPGEICQWKRFWKKQQYLLQVKNLKAIRIIKERSLIKNIALIFLKLLYAYKSQQRIVEELDNNAQKFNGQGLKFVYPNVSGITKEPLVKSQLREIVDYPFESKVFKGFKNADYYLRMTYGNYMQLPPESERVGKHVLKAYWK